MLTIGEKIKQIRIKKGLTQSQLGKLCKPPMADSAIRRYESGRTIPKIETLQKIANALDVSVLDLRSDFEIDIQKLRTDINFALAAMENEAIFLNYLFSLGYEYIDTFHDNCEGYDRCIHVKSDNIDIPLTEKEYEEFRTSVTNDIETQIYKLRKNKGL